MTVLVGVDQGTTGTRAVAFDLGLHQLAESYHPAEVSHPRPGWIEKDAAHTVETVRRALADLRAELGGEVAAVGLDNEGETVVAWDGETLEPLAPAVVWGSRASQPIVDRLASQGRGERIEQLSGLPLDPYFSATKMRWLVEEDERVAAAARAGTLRMGTFDAYITARLGGRARTEPSTAGRTQLQALRAPGAWDPELLRLHDIEAAWLPEIGPSVGALGGINGLPLHALLVDQTASLAGHGCFRAGEAKATYGTGIFLLQQAGGTAPAEPAGLIPIVAWELGDRVSFALDGGVFSAGTVVTWLREGLGALGDAAASEALAQSVPDTGGVRFLPALAGMGAPWWLPDARAVIAGITAGTTPAHIVRAALDALCFRVRDIVDRLPSRPQLLRVDGGLTANGYLVQRQADVLGLPVVVAEVAETTALGAAAMAGIGAGLLTEADIVAAVGGGRRVEPRETGAADTDYQAWRRFAEQAARL
ncbi:MAG TPA: FGGY family carbohydrate kinase [Gaiellales bacterium]|nr:FGGY family carbohydrate kinase [Gaiellales bacterium]